MVRFRARFSFDAGSGICLWAANDATREAFDYPIEIARLPVPNETKALAEQVVRWYDTSLNWSSPAEPLPEPWTEDERRHFDGAVRRLLTDLRHALGDDWEIVDEAKPLANLPGRPEPSDP